MGEMSRMRRRALVAAGLAVVAMVPITAAPAAAASAPAVHVDGNRLVDDQGQTLRLVGVNRASFEYACVSPVYGPEYRNGVSTGPVDAAAVSAIKSWNVNVVRVPLNEDCWLGVNPVKRFEDRVKRLHGKAAKRAGRRISRRYRAGVSDFVSELNAQGIVAILDLHWSAPGRSLADSQVSGPDTSHSIDFWRSVANTFQSNPSVIFDLFNEPTGISWQCLRDGGCPLSTKPVKHGAAKRGGTVAGMQQLVDVVRRAGATQPLMVGGLDYSHDLTRWLEYEPRDPIADSSGLGPQIVASFHNYGADEPDGYICHRECWDEVIAPIAERVPVITGEFGQDVFGDGVTCGSAYNEAYMDWADEHGISYLAWWWSVQGEYDEPACLDLITDYMTGDPTEYGAPIMEHFLANGP